MASGSMGDDHQTGIAKVRILAGKTANGGLLPTWMAKMQISTAASGQRRPDSVWLNPKIPMGDPHELHENELSYFVDSLNPHQRVYLQRLLGECLTALPGSGHEPHPDQQHLVAESTQPLFTLLTQLRSFAPNDEDSDIRPFAVTIPEPGHALLRVSRRITTWRGIWEANANAWVRHLRVGKLTADVGRLEDLTSSVIAWLVTLAQQMPDGRIHLKGANDSMRRAIQVLKLGQVLVPV